MILHKRFSPQHPSRYFHAPIRGRWLWVESDAATSERICSHTLPSRFCALVVGMWTVRLCGIRALFQPHPPQPILYVAGGCVNKTTLQPPDAVLATPSPADSRRRLRRPAHPSHALAGTLPRPARRAPQQSVGISRFGDHSIVFPETTEPAMRMVSIRAGDLVATEAVSQPVGEPSGEPPFVA